MVQKINGIVLNWQKWCRLDGRFTMKDNNNKDSGSDGKQRKKIEKMFIR